MGPFGIPWGMFWLEMFAGPGVFIIACILIRSHWWKNITEYYFSWSDTGKGGEEDE